MCRDDARELSFETMLTDPLVRLVMAADGVSLRELVATMQAARHAVAAREMAALSLAQAPAARSGRA